MSKPQDDLERLQQQQTRLNRIILGALLLILLVSLGIFLASRSKTPLSTPAGGKKTVYLSLSTAPLTSPGTAPATSTPAVTPAMGSTTSTAASAAPLTAATPSHAAAPAVPVRPVIPVAEAHPGAPKAAAPAQEPRKAVAKATYPQTAAKATAQPAPANTCKTAGWYVQLGAFGRVSATQPLVAKLQKQGFSACVATLPQNRLHRVLVGPLPSRFAASNVTARIAQLTGHQGYPQHWPGTQQK
ncbi:SPOR domain-containing protein [Acidithiobacillus sulfuriphilus]|uniref:SPOR domain-containing protein n=1 Tax=Acidithiobacillus sulfuriphilus TaxID=1867749 RepID=UPI003F63CCA7